MAKLKLIIFRVFLSNGSITKLQTVDLEKTAGVAYADEICQIDKINQIQLIGRYILAGCHLVDVLNSLPGHHIVTEHETEGLLERVIARLVLPPKDPLPQLVQRSVLDEKLGLHDAFLLDDVEDALVHLLFDAARRPRDVVHRLGVDAAFSDQLVGF